MTSLLSINSLTKSFGTQRLFEDLSFTISKGDQIGIIGPNGSGKSTLLKIIAKMESPDQGNVARRQGLRVGYASQAPEFVDQPMLDLLIESSQEGDVYSRTTKASILLGKMGFSDPEKSAATLSGGWKKRLDIARALMGDPDILLLDEPTNHLDLEGILWLEQFLNREKLTFIVISHDRYFLENVTNRIIEINKCYPGGMFESQGSLSVFMEHRKAFLDGQEQRQKVVAAQVKDETDWLRRSPKARTTKSLSRINRAYALMDELSEIKQRNRKDRVELSFESSERATRRLLVTKNLGKSLGDKQLFKNVDITLSPGMRLGIVGANGTGKTTLLKILAGEIKQDQGTIKYADDLQLVYFDQHREDLDPEATLRQALSPLSEYVNYRGRSIHVHGWAKRFLFSPDRLELPVKYLSGGERARILIARLMLKPADLLFLDEPTNDLDIPTLEVIEESLEDFPGAVVIVTHDRCLMDRIATDIIGLGTGCDDTLFADYAQWEAASKEKAQPQKGIEKKSTGVGQSASNAGKKKLSFNDQRELTNMPMTIDTLEQRIKLLQADLEQEDVASDSQKSLALYSQIAELQAKLEAVYQRWEELENKT